MSLFFVEKQKKTKKYVMTNKCAYISQNIFLALKATFVLIDVLLFLKKKSSVKFDDLNFMFM